MEQPKIIIINLEDISNKDIDFTQEGNIDLWGSLCETLNHYDSDKLDYVYNRCIKKANHQWEECLKKLNVDDHSRRHRIYRRSINTINDFKKYKGSEINNKITLILK